MSEVKPVAGQWYELDGKRMYCIGLKTSGKAYMEHANENFEVLDKRRQSYLTHLPDCTGWDWEAETFPQYWTAIHESIAFIRRDSLTRTVSVWRDGHEGAWLSEWDKVEARSRTRLTEAEALALLDKPQPEPIPSGVYYNDELRENFYDAVTRKGMGIEFWEKWKHRYKEFPTKPQPAEDPEEWVVQDQVPARPIVDEERWLHRDGKVYIDWRKVYIANTSNDMMHGQFDGKEKLELRCRRKDLPAKKRTITVPKWLITCKRNGQRTIKHQDNVTGYAADIYTVERIGETTYTEQEDGTWTAS